MRFTTALIGNTFLKQVIRILWSILLWLVVVVEVMLLVEVEALAGLELLLVFH
jgi:hypothetical protein